MTNQEHIPKFNTNSLLEYLDQQQLNYQLHIHPPLHSVDDALAYRGDLEGTYVKNLFLQDRDENLYLLTCVNTREIDLQQLRQKINCRRLSFASAEKMWLHLGVKPGSVSPLALLNANPTHLSFYVDQALQKDRINNFHPLNNEMTIQLEHNAWVKLLQSHGFHIQFIDLD
jgi:Ala-tRNA(Pro) deacylase